MNQQPSKDRKPLLSVAVIARNEQDRIGRLLDSIKIADEVVVVDSGSTDNTVRTCLDHGARVIQHEWLGYAAQKQLALEAAHGEWVLNLDADEALSPECADEIQAALSGAGEDVCGFSMPRMSRYLNRWIRHGGWYPDRKVRLVRRGHGRWVGDGLHERLEVSGRVKDLDHPMLHYVYRDISDQIRTIDNFSTLAASVRPEPASRAYLVLGLFHAVGKFFECAVWKRGFLDGLPGLVIAVNSSFYVFLKHAKAWEKGILPEEDP